MVYPLPMFRSIGATAFLISITLCISITHQVSIPSKSDNDLVTRAQGAQTPRPFYLIAHRVLTGKGVDAALEHGANAIEVDMTLYKEGWWADHDHSANSWGDSAKDIFNHIAKERRNGKQITFVWLDIKIPDWCDPDDQEWQHCSVRGLRDLARQILQPAGVRVMYGYILKDNSKTYSFIRDSLNSNEAINLDGNPKQALERFESGGPKDKSRRVSSYGDTELPNDFRNCKEDKYYTCTELRQAVDSAKFGQVFGWVSTIGQGEYVRKELETAGVDGMIYGLKNADYEDVKDTRAAANDLLDWVKAHQGQRFIAERFSSRGELNRSDTSTWRIGHSKPRLPAKSDAQPMHKTTGMLVSGFFCSPRAAMFRKLGNINLIPVVCTVFF